MSFKQYYPDSRSDGLHATLKSKFSANPFDDDIGIIKILSDDTAQLHFPTTGKTSKIMSFDMFTLLKPRSDQPCADENANPNKRSRVPNSPTKNKPASQGELPQDLPHSPLKKKLNSSEIAPPKGVSKKKSGNKGSGAGESTGEQLNSSASVPSHEVKSNHDEGAKLKDTTRADNEEEHLQELTSQVGGESAPATIAKGNKNNTSRNASSTLLGRPTPVPKSISGGESAPATIAKGNQNTTSRNASSTLLGRPPPVPKSISQTPHASSEARLTDEEGGTEAEHKEMPLTLSAKSNKNNTSRKASSTLLGRPPPVPKSISKTPRASSEARLTGEVLSASSQTSDITDASEKDYFRGFLQPEVVTDDNNSDAGSIKDTNTESSASVRSRTLAVVCGDFILNHGSQTFPNLSLLLTYTTINREKERKLSMFPHSAGMKSRHFPGHKAVTGYFLGCIEYSGAPVTYVQIDEHIEIIYKMLYFVASRVSYLLSSTQIYRHFLALFAGSNPAPGSAESATALSCPIAGILNRKFLEFITMDDKVHECFRIPFANKLVNAISHRLESVRTMCTSLDGVTLVGFRCIDGESIKTLVTFLNQWIPRIPGDDGYVSLSADTLSALPDHDPQPDTKRPLFILEKILQLAHFTIPEPPQRRTPGQKDTFMMSYSVNDLLLVAILIYESLCQGKAHVVPNSKRLSGIASLIEEKRLSNRSTLDTTREIFSRKLKDATSDYKELVTSPRCHDLASWRAVTFTAWAAENVRAPRRFQLSEGAMNETVGSFDSLYD